MTDSAENPHATDLSPAEEPAQAALDHAPALAGAFRSFTAARIGLQRSGVSIATQVSLAFQLAHARARDAVHAELETTSLMNDLRSIPAVQSLPEPGIVLLHSMAPDRQTYLQRPDKGRKLDTNSLSRLNQVNSAEAHFDFAIVIADGLSALAIERNCTPLLAELLPMLHRALPSSRLAPVSIVKQGRVAVADEVARALSADLVIVLIGERPGLSSPDSLGVYITWLNRDEYCKNSATHVTDAERNCISNIRSEGLSYPDAASRILYYVLEARASRQTGTVLKDPEPGYRSFAIPKDNPDQPHPILSAIKAHE